MPITQAGRALAVYGLFALFGIAALAQGLAYWPGIMVADAINQYGQALHGTYDDWHPPVMAWGWHHLIRLEPGPAPMFLLQIGLYWAGYGLIVAEALRRGRRLVAGLTVLVALMPYSLAIMGSVLKDCLMEGLLLCATGLFLLHRRRASQPAQFAAILLLFLAALLRFNAFLAALPLLVAVLPRGWRCTPTRAITASLVATGLLVAAMPAANRLIGAEPSDVQLSLVMFDLGGITRRTGVDMFPDVGVANPVAVNARCYRPDKWDSYAFWGHPPCPISFERVDDAMGDAGTTPYAMLAKAVIAHPLAYAEHRAAHFNINARFLVHGEIDSHAPDRSVDNAWHFAVVPDRGLRGFARLSDLSVHSPLGWPIWWMALACGLLALCPRLPSGATIAPIALSGLSYGLGYLLFSVSSELRYHLWTITSIAIAAAFAAGDLRAGAAIGRGRLAACLSPALVVGVLCAVWRLT